MGDKLEGMNAIVTGASRGIGASTALRLAAEGANVAITARTVDKHDHLAGSLNETAAQLRAFGGKVATVVADLADGDDRARIVPEAIAALGGPIDILVNNAAAAMYNSMLDYTLRRRRIMFEINVQAPIDLAQAVIPAMRDAGRGWIVNVSSATARHAQGPPFKTDGVATKVGVYGASKAALNRATNAFAVELFGTGIRINTVEPRAAVMSEGAEALVGAIVKDEQIESMEAMVESIIALCGCEEARTGKVFASLDLLDELGTTVMTLDGTAAYPGGQRVWRGVNDTTLNSYTDIRFEVSDRVALITLNRPDVLNAFSGQMGRELDDAFTRCDADEEIRAVVLTGAGRAFCAGADFSNGPAVFGAPSEATTFSSDPLHTHPWNVRKPVIAAINGHAVGLGMTMTLQCDLRIIARTAKCGIVQNRRGVMPDLHSHWTLPRIVGHARAAEILLTGKMFTGEDAGRWGLANEVLDTDEVLPRALEIAHDIAVNVAPVSVGVSKRLLWRDPPPTREEILQLETDLHLHLMGAPDAREGVMAFLERRDPDWSMTLAANWPTWLDDNEGADP